MHLALSLPQSSKLLLTYTAKHADKLNNDKF